MNEFSQQLEEFSKQFNNKLPELFSFPSGSEQQVSKAMYYSLSNGGKRLRPFLLTKIAELFNVSPSLSFPVAASLEMLHT